MLNKLSFSGGKENPQIFAPIFASHRASHEPLKPVCPLKKTLFPQ
jgi:hypothetical protein